MSRVTGKTKPEEMGIVGCNREVRISQTVAYGGVGVCRTGGGPEKNDYGGMGNILGCNNSDRS